MKVTYNSYYTCKKMVYEEMVKFQSRYITLVLGNTQLLGMLTSCPGTVDQKKPLQSGSSNMYGTKRVKSRTQFKTESRKKRTVTKERQEIVEKML